MLEEYEVEYRRRVRDGEARTLDEAKAQVEHETLQRNSHPDYDKKKIK